MNITVVGCPSGDWEGLFVDGRLVFEGHSITWWQMLEALKIDYDSFDADDEWMMGRGRFPENIDDVQRVEE